MKTKLLLMLLVVAALSVSAVAGPVKIFNPGFEDNVLTDGNYSAAANAWLDSYYDADVFTYADTWASGTYNPTTSDFNDAGEAQEGQNVGATWNYAGYIMGMSQTLTHNFIQGAYYTFTVKVGNPTINLDDGSGVYVGDYLIEIADDSGAVIWTATGAPPEHGEWFTVTIGPSRKQGGPFDFDMPMQIRLLQTEFEGTAYYEHYLTFDDVTLSHDQPSVIIEIPDMITWEGQGVALDATAHDGTLGGNPPTIVSQEWTADPPAGVAFTPNEFALDPTVTITLPVVDLVDYAYIKNADFEDDTYGDGGYEEFPASGDGWIRAGDNWGVGAWDVTALDFKDEAFLGDNIGYVECYNAEGVDGFKQVLQDRLMAGVEYTLTVQVGNTGENTGWAGYHVQLLAGGVILNEDLNSQWPIDANAWKMSTVTFNPGTGHAQEGELLEIRLETLGEYFGPGEFDTSEICYDEVHLTSDVDAFQRSAAYPVVLTLVGTDSDTVDTQPVSVTIDVYKTPCKATIAADLQTDTDFDANCFADVPDLAVVLKTWQDDNVLTTPKAKARSAPPGGEWEIAIINAGFELPVLADGVYQYYNFDDPDAANWYETATYTGVWNTGPAYYGGILPEGENFLFMDGGSGIQQILSETLMAYTNYTLALQVGNNYNYGGALYTIELLAGGTSIASFSEEVDEIQDDTWALRTLNYTYDPANSALIGQPLEIRMALGNPSAGTAIEVNFDDVRLYAESGMDPSPENDGIVHPADPLTLSWTNRAANVDDDVWVDVYFGTDPVPTNNTPVVTKGLNAISTTVDASTVDTTYYWQVDSYLDGSPPDYTPIAGPIWEFETAIDIPVKVEFVNNWVTWSGETVQLASDKVDDTVSGVTYAWIVDPNDGSVEFTPPGSEAWNSTDENPQITMTGDTGDPTVVRVTLIATDATGPATDTLMIAVYDDECAAALGEGEIIDPGDFDANCRTDLADIGAMSAVWDYDYTMIAPAIKPI